VCVCDSLCVSMHYNIKKCCIRNCGNIILNVTACISPIRIRNMASDLAGFRLRASGWGRTSDSKYNGLIISYSNLKNYTNLNDCFKEENKLMVFRIFCCRCK
jgi:hypothetical protein